MDTKNSAPQQTVPLQLYSFEAHRQTKKETDVYSRWIAFYGKQDHQDLLDALVYEHENGFPLRSSGDKLEQLRHAALVEVLQERAHTDFLKAYLADVSTKKN